MVAPIFENLGFRRRQENIKEHHPTPTGYKLGPENLGLFLQDAGVMTYIH